MKRLTLLVKSLLVVALLAIMASCQTQSPMPKAFVHPGIYQNQADLDYMKEQVLAGAEPWKTAFETMKSKTPLDFKVKIERHIIRGPYNNPSIGADDLMRGSNTAYSAALIWYITGDKAYADLAISIIREWAPNVWDFDENDAKLLAGLTGHEWCNAAEILRYTDSGWTEQDTKDFSHMMLGVYLPMIRFYYPEANGNWDGTMIQSIMAMAVFTDNRQLFDNAVNHYLYSTDNGGIFKYIFPSGQCQESTRDQAHVQMGIREFTGGARIAWTQGVDLLGAGDDRLALGYEYTAKFMSGEYLHCYGVISERAKRWSAMYDFAYHYYTAKGYDMPYTKIGVDSTLRHADRPLLVSVLAPANMPAKTKSGIPQLSKIAFPAGEKEVSTPVSKTEAVVVQPGQSLQKAINEAAGTGRWVLAAAGLHTLTESLIIPSGTKLAGEGLATVIHCQPNVIRSIINEDPDLRDITLQDFVLEGAASPEVPSDPNSRRMASRFRNVPRRAGIIFLSNADGQMKNLNFVNITVQNFSRNGIFISGAGNVNIINCNLEWNGSGIVPGPRIHHNLLLAHTVGAQIKDSRIVTSPHGAGISLDHSKEVAITGCEIARNDWYGVRLATCSNITVSGCLIEANSASGVVSEYLDPGSSNVQINDNTIWYNSGYGIESYAAENLTTANNRLEQNGGTGAQEKISNDKWFIME